MRDRPRSRGAPRAHAMPRPCPSFPEPARAAPSRGASRVARGASLKLAGASFRRAIGACLPGNCARQRGRGRRNPGGGFIYLAEALAAAIRLRCSAPGPAFLPRTNFIFPGDSAGPPFRPGARGGRAPEEFLRGREVRGLAFITRPRGEPGSPLISLITPFLSSLTLSFLRRGGVFSPSHLLNFFGP